MTIYVTIHTTVDDSGDPPPRDRTQAHGVVGRHGGKRIVTLGARVAAATFATIAGE